MYTDTQNEIESIFAKKFGTDPETEKALEEKISSFKTFEQETLVSYLTKAHERKSIADNILLILSGYKEGTENRFETGMPQEILTWESSATDGLFIRYNGKGIAVNPGDGFLNAFHEAGFFATDIDFCIVTKESPSSYSDTLPLYNLNFRLNKINPEHKIIHYFLCQKAFRELAHHLKPNFKQERNTVHCLEIFVDSPEVESISLTEQVTLNYFAAEKSLSTTLGISFDLANKKIGYLSGAPWSPFTGPNLQGCDLLICGFGSTSANDFGKLHYNDKTLGYFGTFSLLQEVNPKVLLCTEFDGSLGDIRMEIVRKLRKEFEGKSSTILPGEKGMMISLEAFTIPCAITGEQISVEEIEMMKSAKEFGQLKTLSKSVIL